MTALLTLSLDAATYRGTIALVSGALVLAEAEVEMRAEHEERLLPGIQRVLDAAGAQVRDLEQVVCGAGPGSFTSLRIAASTAKGIAAARGLPLLAVPSLLLMAAADVRPPGHVMPVLDAMRGDVFAAGYDMRADGAILEIMPVSLQRRDALAALAASWHARPIGPREADMAWPHARAVARLERMAPMMTPVDLATWEPDYGRHAEAQVKWEVAHGRPLPAS